MGTASILCPSCILNTWSSQTMSSSRRRRHFSEPSYGVHLHERSRLFNICSVYSFWRKPLTVGHTRRSTIRASSDSRNRVAPLHLESPIGQFLLRLLVSHPHLLPAAVDQQLDQLQMDCEAEKQKEGPSSSGTDLVLYRRIAEVKANERKKALEEILYALIVKKFVDAHVSLVSSLSGSSDPSGRVDKWPPQEEDLAKLHSAEAYEMIQSHLALILGNRMGDSKTLVQISKLRVGQVYAASVMYGYFIKRVDQRFQLEKTLRALPSRENMAVGNTGPDDLTLNVVYQFENLCESQVISDGFVAEGAGAGAKPSRLRSYIMSFDSDTIQRYATIRSKESISIIEKHTEALFGKPEIIFRHGRAIDFSKDEVIKISFLGLQILVLEAVTFGSFLWDVESYVDSRYRFV